MFLLSLACLAPALSAQSVLYWGGGIIDPETTPAQSVNDTATAAGSSNGGHVSGGWSTGITNWNANPDAASGWSGWTDGSIAVFKLISTVDAATNQSTSVITLDESIEAAGVLAEYVRAYSNRAMQNKPFRIEGQGIITLTEGAVLGSNYWAASSGLTINNVLAGTHGFTATGQVILGGNNTISGDVRLASGITLSVAQASSLLGIDSFDVGRQALLTVVNNASGNGSNSIKDTATITLNNARFSLGAGQAGSAETVGSIVLQGSGYVGIADGRTLTLADGLDRGSNQKGVLITTGSANFGTATRLISGTQADTGLLPWAVRTSNTEVTNNDVRFLSIDSDGVFQAVTPETASKDLSEWTYNNSTANVQLIATASPTAEDPTGAITGAFEQDITVNTVALGSTVALSGNNSSNNTVTLDFGGHTLTTQAVAAAVNSDRWVSYRVGLSANDQITSSTGELYLIHDRNNNTALGGFFYLNAAVVDSGDTPVSLILGGSTSQFELHRTNTHTGKTYVNAAAVTLGNNGRLLSTSELNLSRGSLFINSGSNAGNVWGGGDIEQTLSGGGTYRAANRPVVIGAKGTLAPGNLGAGETFTFELSGTSKLQFNEGSTVVLTLGTLSDSIAFTTAGDWLTGSGNFTLDLTSGDGFQHGVAYTIFSNVTTAGFTPGSVLLDGNLLGEADYTWTFADNSYFFTSAIPEPSTFALLLGAAALGAVALRRRRR